MPGFRDQHPWRLADDPYRLRKYDLYVTRVEADRPADLNCSWGWMHTVERDNPAFGFRDHLLRDDHNITHLEGHPYPLEASHDEVRQRGALDDLREAGDRVDRDRTQARGGRPARARSATPSASSRRRGAVSRGSSLK